MIKKRENARIKHLNNSNAFIEYSKSIDDVYNNIDDYNLTRKRNFLCVFDDMIADILTKNNFLAVLKELLIRCRKLNVSIVVITKSYFSVPKEVRLNSTHHLSMKMHRKELQNIASNYSADIDYKGFMEIYSKCTSEPSELLKLH